MVDGLLAEWLLTLHFAECGKVLVVYPLLVGSLLFDSASVGGGGRVCSDLIADGAVAYVPDVRPSATMAFVEQQLERMGECDVARSSELLLLRLLLSP